MSVVHTLKREVSVVTMDFDLHHKILPEKVREGCTCALLALGLENCNKLGPWLSVLTPQDLCLN